MRFERGELPRRDNGDGEGASAGGDKSFAAAPGAAGGGKLSDLFHAGDAADAADVPAADGVVRPAEGSGVPLRGGRRGGSRRCGGWDAWTVGWRRGGVDGAGRIPRGRACGRGDGHDLLHERYGTGRWLGWRQ